MPPTGNIHFLGRFRDIQRGKLEAELLGVVRLDSRLGACLEETFQPFVLEALDHTASVRCRFMLGKDDRQNKKSGPFGTALRIAETLVDQLTFGSSSPLS